MKVCPRCDKRYDDEDGRLCLCSDCYADGVMPFGDDEAKEKWRAAWVLHNSDWTDEEIDEHYGAAWFSGGSGIVLKLARK